MLRGASIRGLVHSSVDPFRFFIGGGKTVQQGGDGPHLPLILVQLVKQVMIRLFCFDNATYLQERIVGDIQGNVLAPMFAHLSTFPIVVRIPSQFHSVKYRIMVTESAQW